MELKELQALPEKLHNLLNEPESIFKGPFVDGEMYRVILRNIHIDDKSLAECLEEKLQKLPVFQDTRIHLGPGEIHVYVKYLKDDEVKETEEEWFSEYILGIYLTKRLYEIRRDSEECYHQRTSKQPELVTKELSEFWQDFDNYTMKRRFRRAFKALKIRKPNRNLVFRLKDFVYCLFVSREKVERTVLQVKLRLADDNHWEKEHYELRLKTYNFYKEHTANHITKTNQKRDEIIRYMQSFGYKEV